MKKKKKIKKKRKKGKTLMSVSECPPEIIKKDYSQYFNHTRNHATETVDRNHKTGTVESDGRIKSISKRSIYDCKIVFLTQDFNAYVPSDIIDRR